MISKQPISTMSQQFYYVRSEMSMLTRKVLAHVNVIDENPDNIIEIIPNDEWPSLANSALRSWHLKDMCSVSENHPYLFDLVIREYIDTSDLDWNSISICATDMNMLNTFKRKLNWNLLCHNPNAVGFIMDNLNNVRCKENINWQALSENPSAIPLLTRYPDKIYWPALCANKNAGALLNNCPENKLDLYRLATNPNAIHIFEKHASLVFNLDIWAILAVQPSEDAVDLVIANLYEGVNLQSHGGNCIIGHLAENPLAIWFIEQQLNNGLVNWEDICGGLCRNPKAIPLLQKYHLQNAYIDWEVLAGNPNAKDMVLANPENISYTSLAFNHTQWAVDYILSNTQDIPEGGIVWFGISSNPNALALMDRCPERVFISKYLQHIPACTNTYVYDYEFIRTNHYELHEELTAFMHHPCNLVNGKLATWGFFETEEEEDEDN